MPNPANFAYRSPQETHASTFQDLGDNISPEGRLLGTGTPWTTAIDRHDVVTTSSNPIATSVANGRFVIGRHNPLTNISLAFNFNKATDPSAETCGIDVWFGRVIAIREANVYEVLSTWQGVYTILCATTGTALAVPTTSAYNPTGSAFCAWGDNITDPGSNPYPWVTKICRKNNGAAVRSWDLVGHQFFIGQVRPASGVSMGGVSWRF